MQCKRRIGEMLVAEGLVTPKDVEAALRRQQAQGGKMVENLVALGCLTLEDFSRFLARQPGMPSVALAQYCLPQEVIALVPRAFAFKHEIIPIDRMGRLLTVGMAFPLDAATIAELQSLTGLTVKPLLCSPEDIRQAIAKYYRSEPKDTPAVQALPVPGAAEVRLSNLPSLIRQMDSLPALPDTLQKVREALDDEEVTIREVADVIRRDPSVAAKLIGVANSAALAFSQRVESVEMATSLMGLRDTYSLVASVTVMETFDGAGPLDGKRFWQQSMDCANAAAAIGSARGMRHTANLYAAALLHNIGRLVLATLKPEQYARIGTPEGHEALIAAETREFGLAHPEAGYLLAEAWNLPDDMAEAIRFHHDLANAKKAPELVATVQLADALCEARQVEDSLAAIAESCGPAIECLGVTEDVLVALQGVIVHSLPGGPA